MWQASCAVTPTGEPTASGYRSHLPGRALVKEDAGHEPDSGHVKRQDTGNTQDLSRKDQSVIAAFEPSPVILQPTATHLDFVFRKRALPGFVHMDERQTTCCHPLHHVFAVKGIIFAPVIASQGAVSRPHAWGRSDPRRFDTRSSHQSSSGSWSYPSGLGVGGVADQAGGNRKIEEAHRNRGCTGVAT